MNGVRGISGWRWLFILEGAPSCLSAILIFFFLPDWPNSATWLSEMEKELSYQRLYHEGSNVYDPTLNWKDIKLAVTDWRLYAHYAMYFAVSPAFTSLSLFAPSITAGLGYVDLQAQLMTVPPWIIAFGESYTLISELCGAERASRLSNRRRIFS